MLCRGRSTVKTILACFVCITCAAAGVYGGEADVHARRNGDSLLVSMALPPHIRPDIIQSLDSGLRSEISFEIRLYRETRGVRALFGDRLLREESITFQGKHDSFENTYQIFSSDGIESFTDPREFMNNYYNLYSAAVPFHPEEDERYYLLARIVAQETKLVPPLNLLTPFLRGNRTVTAWRRVDLPCGGGTSS